MQGTKAARLGWAFTRAARCYWWDVHPKVRREEKFWREKASRIPDPVLRRAAFATQQTKFGNSEGAAAFAVLVPAANRSRYVRLLVAFELLADYLDTISEAKADDVLGNNLRLHRAMAVALELEAEHDYYALHPQSNDGGYVDTHISVCREIVAELPAYASVRDSLQTLVARYGESQSLHHIRGSLEDAMAAEQTGLAISCHPRLDWREVVVAGGSTLAMLALLAAANDPMLTRREADLIFSAYYPAASALHIMLDGFVDHERDQATGDVSQMENYGSWREARRRLSFLASQARISAAGAPRREMHEVLLAGMAGYYLAQPEAWTKGKAEISRDVLEALGPMARAAVTVHRLGRASGVTARAGRDMSLEAKC